MSLAFFLIVPSVMIVSVVLIRALGNRVGLRLYYPTLAAVAITTVPVTFLATRLSPAIGREYLLWLGALIAASSGVLTFANKFLLNRELEEERRFTEEVKAAYEAEKRKSLAAVEDEPVKTFEFKPPAYNESLDKPEPPAEVDDSPAEVKAEVNEPPAEVEVAAEVDDSPAEVAAEVDDSPAEVAAEVNEPPAEVEVAAEVDDSPAEVKAEVNEPPAEFPLEKVFEPLPEPKPEDVDEPPKVEPKPPDEFPLEKVFKPLSEVKHEEVAPPVEQKLEPEKQFPLQEVFEPLSTLNLNKLEEITQNAPHEEETLPEERIDTLDDLLDKAYDERDKGHVWQAIATYRKVLERYHNDEYAPFVAIDLGNIYKEQALYSEAIKTYERALTLPAVKRNDSAKKEFLSNLRYLRLVREVLLKHRALSTPFSQLPKEILQEVDSEFKKVQYQ